MQEALHPQQQHCIQLKWECRRIQSLHDNCIHLHRHCILQHTTMAPHGGTLLPLHEHCIHITEQCRGHCNHCRTLHPTEVALKAYCNHCQLTASNSWAVHPQTGIQNEALQPLQGHCSQLKWHCRCTEMNAGSLHPPSCVLHPTSQHTASTLGQSAEAAWALDPLSETLQWALQPLQQHCIQL